MSRADDRADRGGESGQAGPGDWSGGRDGTAEPPDPDPAVTPGLEAGGSVAPGDTPPAEAGTSGLSAPEPRLPSKRSNAAIALAVLVVIIATALGLLAGRVF